MNWVIEPLEKHHDRAAFSCEHESLTRYLINQTLEDPQRFTAANFVACAEKTSVVLGYYALSSYTIERAILPKPVRSALIQRYETYPAIMLGRLARDITQRGMGLGEVLLVNALLRSLEVAETQVGALAVVVDSIDDKAHAWYEKYGFASAGDSESRLFMLMQDIRSTFGSETA